jgi:hypothetical protein
MNKLLESSDETNIEKIDALAHCTLYSLYEEQGITEGYFETFSIFLSKLNWPITLDAFY